MTQSNDDLQLISNGIRCIHGPIYYVSNDLSNNLLHMNIFTFQKIWRHSLNLSHLLLRICLEYFHYIKNGKCYSCNWTYTLNNEFCTFWDNLKEAIPRRGFLLYLIHLKRLCIQYMRSVIIEIGIWTQGVAHGLGWTHIYVGFPHRRGGDLHKIRQQQMGGCTHNGGTNKQGGDGHKSSIPTVLNFDNQRQL